MGFERIVPGTIEWDAYFANHIFRYQFALQHLQIHHKQKVLDAACGVGYGTHFLATEGVAQLVGVDRDDDALKVAVAKFSHPSLKYLKDDCHTLENASQHGSFDAVVSFETLEHLPNPQAFLKQSFSLLASGGILIISTPNAFVTSPDGKTDWEVHEREYTSEELKTIIEESGYKNCMVYGQSYSAIGKLRQEVRGELNAINSNPFNRAGRWIQKILKGHRQRAILPEKTEDFEITKPEDFIRNPPFVLLAVAFK